MSLAPVGGGTAPEPGQLARVLRDHWVVAAVEHSTLPPDVTGEAQSEPRHARPNENDEIDDFIGHARWLMDFHTKRSDGISSRSVALLGFVGVILALLSRGFDLASRVHATGLIVAALVATVLGLTAAAGFVLLAIATHRVGAPKVDQARALWAGYLADTANRGHARVDVAESLLVGTRLTQDSPVSLAKEEADSRARHFRHALFALAISFAGLAALIVQTYLQIGGLQ